MGGGVLLVHATHSAFVLQQVLQLSDMWPYGLCVCVCEWLGDNVGK